MMDHRTSELRIDPFFLLLMYLCSLCVCLSMFSLIMLVIVRFLLSRIQQQGVKEKKGEIDVRGTYQKQEVYSVIGSVMNE